MTSPQGGNFQLQGWQGGLPRERHMLKEAYSGKYTCGGYSEEEPCTRRHLADAQATDTGASLNSAGGTQGFNRRLS